MDLNCSSIRRRRDFTCWSNKFDSWAVPMSVARNSDINYCASNSSCSTRSDWRAMRYWDCTRKLHFWTASSETPRTPSPNRETLRRRSSTISTKESRKSSLPTWAPWTSKTPSSDKSYCPLTRSLNSSTKMHWNSARKSTFFKNSSLGKFLPKTNR